jgi:hypothetical protein
VSTENLGREVEAAIEFGRREERFRTGDGKPVVALDIDGTLGDYHAHFLWFAEQWLGRKMPDPRDVNPGMRLSDFMGVPHHIYRDCKLAYRQGGLKRFMPAYPYATHLTNFIREEGAQVWLCTTRPYLRLDNIDPDTREWLRRNDIKYDAVIFDDLEGAAPKYQELVRQVGLSRIVAVCDDLPEQLWDAESQGIKKVYVRDQPYNRDFLARNRVKSLPELTSNLITDIRLWKVQHEQNAGPGR